MDECIFCKKLKTEDDIVYRDNLFAAQIDRFPISPGHGELFPVRHFANAEEMNREERMQFWEAYFNAKDIFSALDYVEIYTEMAENPINEISKGMCEYMLSLPFIKNEFVDYNGAWNNGRLAGRTVDHLHFHIIPRHEGDVPNPVGGCRNIIPGMGDYKNWKKPE